MIRVARRKKVKLWTRIKRAVKNVGTLNIVLIVVGAFFIWFNAQLLDIYRERGTIPEGYANTVIAATIGECGICGWIRTSKDKRRDRRWEMQEKERSDTE